uniref:Glycine-rich protein n=1 Tax=Ononis spinosa TaxID=58890 RepID=A0A411AFL0_ONOSP|nr:glycine-rich protein [Ononis spinosa]
MKTNHFIFFCFFALLLISVVAIQSFQDDNKYEIEESKTNIEIDNCPANLIRKKRSHGIKKPRDKEKHFKIKKGKKEYTGREKVYDYSKKVPDDGEKRQGNDKKRLGNGEKGEDDVQ